MSQKMPQLNIIERLSFKLGPAFRRALGELERRQTNKDANKVSTTYAKEAKTEILEFIKEQLAVTEKPVLSGDIALEDLPENEACWLVEPICGWQNFTHSRLPVGSLFIYMKDRKPIFTAVYFAYTDELVTAEYGNGAKGPIKLRVANREAVDESLVNFAPKAFNDAVARDMLTTLQDANASIRHSGNLASDLVDVAAGTADAVIATEMPLAYQALAHLMIKEAGGYVTNFSGDKPSLNDVSMIAANPKLHAEFIKALA